MGAGTAKKEIQETETSNELAPPEIKRQRRHVQLRFLHQPTRNSVIGETFQPAYRARDHLFGVAMEFQNEAGQQRKGVTAERTEQSFDGNRGGLSKGSQRTLIGTVPPQVTCTSTPFTLRGFRNPLFLETR